MGFLSIASMVIMALDNIHDILCPFFNDHKQMSDNDLDKILKKLETLEKELKEIKESKK